MLSDWNSNNNLMVTEKNHVKSIDDDNNSNIPVIQRG